MASGSLELVAVMVQLFNVPEITLFFLKHNQLLECFMSVLNHVIGSCIDRYVARSCLELRSVVFCLGNLQAVLDKDALHVYSWYFVAK